MKNPKPEITTHRARSTLATAVTALVFLPPFAVNNLLDGRYLIGCMSLLIVTILAVHSWLIYRGHYYPLITVGALIPATVVFLALSIRYQQIIGVLWCYPAIVVFFSLLPKRKATVATGVLLAIASPLSLMIFDGQIAARIIVTLFAVTIFTYIFVSIIESQQRRLKRQQAEVRDAMASASHELRTPITAIAAQIHALRDGVHPPDQNHLDSLLDSVTHLSGLVDDMFLLSLADTNELSVELEPARLGEIVEAGLSAMREYLSQHGLTVKTDLDRSLVVPCDARRVRQIVGNLLENCGRYTEKGGTVSVSVSRQSAHARLQISDSGPGVDDRTLSALFDRFYRADRSRSRTLGGTGMGLAVVKALAEAHGGSAGAFHAPEGGLGIEIRLPMQVGQRS